MSNPRPQPQDHLRSRKKPMVTKVPIAADAEVAADRKALADRVALLEIQLRALEDAATASQLAEAAEALRKFDEEHPDNIIMFRFKALNRKKFQDLIKQHPPTAEQIAEAKEEDQDAKLDFNPDTFPQVLIARSMIQEEMSESELIDWLDGDEWNQTELLELFGGAYGAQLSRAIPELGKG